MPAAGARKQQQQAAFRYEADGIVYRVAQPSDAEALWRLMSAEFYPRTELCRCLAMRLPDDVAVLRGLLPGMLAQGVTLVAEEATPGTSSSSSAEDSSATPQLVGARPSTIECEEEEEGQRHPLLVDAELAKRYAKCSTVYRMFDHLASSVNLFHHYDITRALSFKFLVVAESHARRGIAQRLVQLSMELGRSAGLPVACVCTASRHSERIYERLQFDCLSRLRLREYVDLLVGGRPFADLDETVLQDAVLYAKRL